MYDTNKYFVGTCTHVNDTPKILSRHEIDFADKKRICWLQGLYSKGVRTKVAYINNEPVGFIHLIPMKYVLGGPIGKDFCLNGLICLVIYHQNTPRAKQNSV